MCELELIIFLFCTGLEPSTSRLKHKHSSKRSNVDGCVKIDYEMSSKSIIVYCIIVTSLMIISHHLPEKKISKLSGGEKL